MTVYVNYFCMNGQDFVTFSASFHAVSSVMAENVSLGSSQPEANLCIKLTAYLTTRAACILADCFCVVLLSCCVAGFLISVEQTSNQVAR